MAPWAAQGSSKASGQAGEMVTDVSSSSLYGDVCSEGSVAFFSSETVGEARSLSNVA
jgi:hypothetical protein